MLAQTYILALKTYAENNKTKQAGTNEVTIRIWIK